jgi:FtsZ-binding cell division protein ZapB
MKFTRDEKSIRSNTFSGGSIKTTGLHKGFITKAYVRNSKSSEAIALHLDFLSEKGESGQIDLWHTKANGEPMERSVATIQGLMSLLDINDLREKNNDLIEQWNKTTKQIEQVRMTSYPQLLNQPIGTIWQVEEYIKQVEESDGVWINSNPIELKERAVFIAFCDPESKQTAIELLDDAEAQDIDKMLKRMDPVKRVNLPKAQLQQAKDTASTKKANDPDFDFNDSIPF